uniref:Uncharacterized protein n=1 Tax=Globisporangium ultimum (strain ATCC 200006 / CBS 805.95 / DAOM BR144) TaxID=431595 RepID=K3WLA2_GLOUD
MSSLATPTAQHSSDAVSISKTSFLNAPRPSQQPTCSGQVVDESREIDICCHPLAKKNKTDSVKAAPNTIQPDEDLLTASEDATAKNDSVDSFFSVMHAEIKKLQRGDAHDCSAKLYQLLLKFQSEARLLNLSTASNISELKRKRQDSTDGLPLDLLLHEKAVSEIALLKLQAERVQAQLDRERMKTKVEAVLSKKKLEDASTPESTVNWIISQRMLGRPW